MKRPPIIVLILISIALLQGCSTQRETGALTGAAIGTAAGSIAGGTEATIIGGLLGTIVGHEVGFRMDREDRRHTSRALEHNPTGETSRWTNPDTGRSYRVTPRDTFHEPGKGPCREFTFTSEHRGETVQTQEVACRRADGSWEIVE
ncbi:MAG: RT0821/Lpp0805 family surface protein [Wenzhouxiangellaceae bacterium]|nr:RT0821/Lpp0805 family surface protein [Wenzhouxiangellaceae bacterium]